jgi:outer membrane protein assembly factor BamA
VAPADTDACATPREAVEPSAAAGSGVPGKLGLRYEIEAIRVHGNRRTSDRVILRYVPYQPGDQLEVDDEHLELTRFRLLGTGFFSDVQLSLTKGSKRGLIVLNVTVLERNTIVVNDLWLGLSADARLDGAKRPLTAFGGADLAETNFFGTGVSIGGGVAVADRQQAYRLRFVDPSFLRSAWIVSASLLYNNARDFFGNCTPLPGQSCAGKVQYDPAPGESTATDFAVALYSRTGFELGAGYDLGTSTRLRGAYHLEVVNASLPAAASQYRGYDQEPIEFHLINGRSVLSLVSLQLEDDTRDDPILPTRGYFVQLGLDLGLSSLGSDYAFLRFQGRGSKYWTLPWGGDRRHVFRLDGFAGAITGDAPLFMRFYVGDLSDFLPDRALDLNFDRRPSPNFLRTNVGEMRYEELAARLVGEYRIPIYRGHRSIYGIDFFASAGFFALGSKRDFTEPARGFGGFSRFPVDLTFNLGLRISTNAGGFLLGFSNAIGAFPIRSEAK